MNIDLLNNQFAKSEPEELLSWSIENLWPEIAMTSSFQITGLVIIDMIRKFKNDFPLVFIDTGFHFPETYNFIEKLQQDWKLNITKVQPSISKTEFNKNFGKDLYKHDPELCCQINKIEPQRRFMKESKYRFWISGLRKDQAKTRENHKLFMKDGEGKIRIHPLINWTWNDVWNYLDKNNIPVNDLYKFGYTSIGCMPCTQPGNGSDERAGRWKNFSKTECGLHYHLVGKELQNAVH